MSSSRPLNPRTGSKSAPASPMTSRHHPPAPIRISAPVPSSHPQRTNSERRKPDRHSWRESIIRSPYPPGYKGKEAESRVGGGRADALLALVLYNRRTRVPIMKRMVIPGVARETEPEDTNSLFQRSTIHTNSGDFDDERLFKLIGAEYRRMRGGSSLPPLFHVRGVRDLGFLSFAKPSQLVKQDRGCQRRKTFPVNGDDGFAETELLILYQKPRLGRGEHAWVDWIARRPENNGVQVSEKIALELVEGWCVEKIAVAVLAVVVSSLLATALWTFLGVGGCTLCFLRQDQEGFRNAGGRLETGVALGILVLMLGWTGVGAWVLLSWLV